ncbi:cyanophycin synthetase [Clostridium niameyense]|uniref:cyanophycin synthetase n=1 Tax=Clostridium niameyense TaxID=1622073 RepID=UPI00067E6B31|nr:cyanophycin synthetase [Clostridium niameyense]
MKIEKVRVFEGRNIYSHKRCIKMNLDLEGYSDVSSKEISGFNKALLGYLPSLREHCCSIGEKGGFLQRLYEGTYLSHICEHTVIALENILDIDVSYGKAREIGGEKYYIIYEYKYRNTGIECGKIAVELINSIINNKDYNLKNKIEQLKYILKTEELGPSTLAIINEAKKHNIPITKIGENSMFQLGYGVNSQRVEATICDSTSTISVDIACDKLLTKDILNNQCVPTAKGYRVNNYIDLLIKADNIGYPVVLKPRFGNQGKGVFVNIKTQDELINDYRILSKDYKEIIIEKFIHGKDYRICIVDGKFIAAAQRIPPYVIGNGINSVQELISELNKDSRRGEGHEKPLTKIKIDKELKENIAKQGFDLNSIISKNQKVILRQNANLSTGGIAIDCTDIVSDDVKDVCIRAAKAIGLNICGIDLCCRDISNPLDKDSAIMEVNAAPGIRMHQYPYKGKSRNVAKAIIDMMFKNNKSSIPIISVTGTNGKTTTTRLISHILKKCGKSVGMTTTGGIYINDKCIEKGDTTGYDSATTILTNNEIDIAVLELARGGLIKGGLPYNLSDIAIITNITEDHLGLDGINTLEDMAYVKSLVGEAVKEDGYVVINADDKASINIIDRMRSKIILFSKDKDNIILNKYLKRGSMNVYLHDDFIYMQQGNIKKSIINVKDIPITLGGKLDYNIENSMAVISALIGMGIDIEYIKEGISTFYSNEYDNPGRFNLYNLEGCSVILDYGHNIEGYKAVFNGVEKIKHKSTIGVIGVPGDRTNSSMMEIGNICGKFFDYIYIKEDRDKRGRKVGEVANLIKNGILDTGFDKNKIKIILDEEKALKEAIEKSNKNDLVVMFFEEFEPALNIVKEKAKKGKGNEESIALA